MRASTPLHILSTPLGEEMMVQVRSQFLQPIDLSQQRGKCHVFSFHLLSLLAIVMMSYRSPII